MTVYHRNFDVILQSSTMTGMDGTNLRLDATLEVKRTIPIQFFVLITAFTNCKEVSIFISIEFC
jgi:hypothetical protein